MRYILVIITLIMIGCTDHSEIVRNKEYSILAKQNEEQEEKNVEEEIEEEIEEVVADEDKKEEELDSKKSNDVISEADNSEDIVLDGSENTIENTSRVENNTEEAKIEKKKEVKKKETKKKEVKEKESKKVKGGSYKVKSGDNLGKIAEKYHIKVEALKKANNIKDDQINVGQDLKIPN